MANFKAVSAPKMPKMACVGSIANIADTKESQSGSYNVTNVKIEPRGGGYAANTSILTRPEWLSPGYNPDVEMEGNKGGLFVYQTNIQGPGNGPSKLLGLTGSEEGASQLVDDIFASVEQVTDDEGNTVSIVSNAKLDAAIRKNAGTLVGYVLQQKMEDTGETDENGKKVKIRTANYELGQFFYPTEESLKRFRKLAKDKPDEWRVAFDEAF